MNKRGMGVMTMILILMALTIGTAVSIGKLTPEQVDIAKTALNNASNIDMNFNTTNIAPELGNALDYYVEGLLKAYVEIMKWTMSYAAEHPEIPFKLLLYLFILAIVAPLIILLFKLIVITFLLIKEFIQNRKEKKELRRLKYNESLER